MNKLCSTVIAMAVVLLTGCSQHNANASDEQVARLLSAGLDHIEQRDMEAAMQCLKEAEQLMTPETDHRTACRVLEHIAWLNANSGEQQLALIYFDYALPHSWATADESLVADVLIGKAHVLNELGESEHAFQINQQAEALSQWADDSQRSAMLTNHARHQLLHDSIDEAEANARRALGLAADTATLGNAFALLSHIYQRQGDSLKLQQLLSRFNESSNAQVSYSRLRIQYDYYLGRRDYRRALEAYRLMQNVGGMMDRSREQVALLKVQNQWEREKTEREKAEQKWWYTLAVVVLMNAVFVAVWWYSRKQHRAERQHQQQMRRLRRQMDEKLRTIVEATHAQLAHSDTAAETATAPAGAADPDAAAKAQLPSPSSIFSDSIAETKAGIDALYDIIAGNNISQYGKQQERQVAQVLWQVNPRLAKIIDDSPQPLTPKETFFCIMEHYGKSDDEKARSFCCSEQAIRSTKSRLGKKLDIATLRQQSPTKK